MFYLFLNLSHFGINSEFFTGLVLFYIIVFGTMVSMSKSAPLLQKILLYAIFLVLNLTILILFKDFFLYCINITIFKSAIKLNNLNFLIKILVILFSTICLFVIFPYLIKQKINNFEYIILIFFVLMGLLLLISANDFITAYLALEMQGLSFYIMASFKKNSNLSIESGLKYFILGSFSSSLFLFGVSIFYGILGTTVLVAILSIILGSFVGLEQRKVKSLLAYSSIGHMGYLMLSFCTGTFEGLQGLILYLVIYLITSFCIWGVFMFTKLGNKYFYKLNKELMDFVVLNKSNKYLNIIFCVIIFSLAGFPPMVGFLAKLWVFLSTIEISMYYVSVSALICSVVSTFYYLRFVKTTNFENILIGKLYFPIKSEKSVLIGFLSFLLFFFFFEPNSLYLFTYKFCYNPQDFSILPISKVDEILRLYYTQVLKFSHQVTESNQVQNTESMHDKQPGILATSGSFNHSVIPEFHQPFYNPKMPPEWNAARNCIYSGAYSLSKENIKLYYETISNFNSVWEYLSKDSHLEYIQTANPPNKDQVTLMFREMVEDIKSELEELRGVLEKTFEKTILTENEVRYCKALVHNKSIDIKAQFLYFYLKLVCLIAFVSTLKTLKTMFLDSIFGPLKLFLIDLSIKIVASFSGISLKIPVGSLFMVLFLPTALYFINESIYYVFDLFETLIEKYLKHTQNLLINLFKDQENSLNNPSESVTILEKGISDIKFDKVNLQDPTSEDTENYRNLVKKNSNVYIGSIALILAASLLCAITISFYST